MRVIPFLMVSDFVMKDHIDLKCDSVAIVDTTESSGGPKWALDMLATPNDQSLMTWACFPTLMTIA